MLLLSPISTVLKERRRDLLEHHNDEEREGLHLHSIEHLTGLRDALRLGHIWGLPDSDVSEQFLPHIRQPNW